MRLVNIMFSHDLFPKTDSTVRRSGQSDFVNVWMLFFFIVLRNNHSNNFQRHYNSVACLQFAVSSAQVTHGTKTSIQWVAFEFVRVMTVAFRFKLALCWKHKGSCVPVCAWARAWVRTCVGTYLYSRRC